MTINIDDDDYEDETDDQNGYGNNHDLSPIPLFPKHPLNHPTPPQSSVLRARPVLNMVILCNHKSFLMDDFSEAEFLHSVAERMDSKRCSICFKRMNGLLLGDCAVRMYW